MTRLFTLGLLLLCALTGLQAQERPFALRLAGREVELLPPDMLREYMDRLPGQDQAVQLYLRFEKAPDQAGLKAAGIELQGYIQQNVYNVVLRRPLRSADMVLHGIGGWAAVMPEDKINPLFLREDAAFGKGGEVLLLVTKGMNEHDLQLQLDKLGIRLSAAQNWKSQDLWQAVADSAQIRLLAARHFIRFINPLFTPVALNHQAIGFTNTQIAHQPVSIGGRNLQGSGVTVGVGDNSDPDHVDYIDRVISFNPVISTTHAFHTTGTVGGAGLRDERFKGFAPRSRLIEDFFSQIISNGATYYQDFGMVTSNNSYGNILGDCGYAGTYDVYTQYCDQQMRDIPELLTVFAAGNDGLKNCTPYPAGYATVAGSYQTAKNVLTVADIGKTRLWEHFTSSRGPVKDGRLKPEITAVGTRVISCIDNNDYAINSGTSIACPNVTGAAALLYERYRQLHGGQNPQGALIKALLMNGADDLDQPGPDFHYGFGLMNFGHTLNMLENNRYFSGAINTAQEQTYTFTVPANTARAKVMLYWNDPAAQPLAAHALINDLDLTVTTPSGTTVLPLVLDTLPAQVTAPAVPGIDRINNVEQVTLNNPAAGTYTIKVKGFNVPEINQEYFVAYDLAPAGVTLQYPFGGESLVAGDSLMIYWEASDDPNPFTLSYSVDNGNSWTVISSNIAASLRSYTWYMPATLVSDQCRIRIARNNTGQQSQSQSFILLGRPEVTLATTPEQCPGSIRISWNTIAGANGGYRVFRKLGAEMVQVAAVSGNTYTLTGLDPDSTYWVAVAPVINGKTAMRSVAVSRKPADGSCNGVAHGDLRMAEILSPGTGRLYTSTALSGAQPLTVLVSNLDDQTAANYRIAYRVNSGPWQSSNYTDLISPAGNRQITLGNLNLAAAGTYQITVAVTNLALTDPQSANDTIVTTVKQVDNPVMNLSGGYEEGFEATSLSMTGRGMVGIDGAEKWDFGTSQPKGRIRSWVNSGITISGSRSASMDNAVNQVSNIAGSSYNTLTGTFNLSSYNTTNWEVRCEFDYVMHGLPKFDTGNSVWVRGSDTDPWVHLLDYQIDTVNMGVIYSSGSISLTDVLNAAGQNFSSSTQLRFTQYDTSLIAAPYFGNGVTIDNFSLYLVTDDVALLSVDSVYHYNCGLSNQVPMKIRVRNGVNNTVYNVQVAYRLDNQAVVTGVIDSIAGKDTVSYTFDQPMDLSANAAYNLSVWVYLPTDTYRINDSILDFKIKNQPVIATFPYLQDFESGDGSFYADGSNSSWAYGPPAAAKISHAASGTKAWKTGLAGTYNRLEYSYLYSPCFDISQLTLPVLSFSLATDIEDPGSAVFDMAYVEYSHDGHTWQRLGQAGAGTNWYTNDSVQGWTRSGETYWHVATIPLPKDGNIVSFRFVLRSDQGAELEGIAVDDIHVYDLRHPIFNQDQFPAPVVRDIAAGQQADYTSGNDIGLSLLNTTSSALGNTEAQAYKHTAFINEDSTQYFLPKNFVVQAAAAPSDSVTLRLYVPDEAMRTIREDAVCYSCSKVREVQELGITKYDDPDKGRENNTLADNLNGSYSFIPREKIRWVPYDAGYYAELKVKSFSEFWFNDGGPTRDQLLTANLFDFTAAHYGARHAMLQWSSMLDPRIASYELQRADAALAFSTVASVAASGQPGYSYIDTPVLTGSATVYYRIRYILDDGSEHYSLIRSLDWGGMEGAVQVYPNPVRHGQLHLEWFKGTGDGLQWSLYSITGQLVVRGNTDQDSYNGRHTFDLSRMGLTPGLYVLRVVSGKDKWEFKVVYQ